MLVDELLNVIKERRSVRKFSQGQVSDREIHLLLEAARFAPSNSNRQAWKFLIVRSRDVIKNIASAVDGKTREIRAALIEPELDQSFEDYARY